MVIKFVAEKGFRFSGFVFCVFQKSGHFFFGVTEKNIFPRGVCGVCLVPVFGAAAKNKVKIGVVFGAVGGEVFEPCAVTPFVRF
jgi:hypothetical protein